MVYFKIFKLTDKEATYEYYPENNREAPGTITVDLNTGDINIDKEAADDFGKRYANHAIRKIREFYVKNSFDKEGMAAWY